MRKLVITIIITILMATLFFLILNCGIRGWKYAACVLITVAIRILANYEVKGV